MKKLLLASGAIVSLTATAAAQPYLAGTIGNNALSDSDNEGVFSQDFTIAGTALDGTTLPGGTPVSWNTEFDSAIAFSAAIGMDYGKVRLEAELARADHDVDTHTNVFAGSTSLTGVDATVLVASTSDDLGITVDALVAAGEGSVATTYGFINAYYDVENDSDFTPYVGVGIGFASTDVEFAPSATGIVDDDATTFAYQVMVGGNFAFTENLSGFGELSYRDAGDVEVDVDLFPAELEIENRATVFEVGLRYDLGN